MKQKLHYHLPKCLMLLIICLLSVNSWGQTTIFSVSGGGAFPSGWTSANNVPTNDIDKSSYYLLDAGNPSDVITTSSYNLSSYTSAVFTINVATFDSGTANPGKIEISYNGGTTFTQTTTTTTPSSSTYVGSTINLNSVSSQVVIRISNNGTSGRGIRVQAIKLVASGTATVPAITATPSTVPGFGNVNVGTNSANSTVTISGANLTGDITVNAPSTDFQISKDQSAWSGSVSLTQTSGTITNVPVYVRFTPQSVGAKSGNITFSGGGVSSPPTVAVSGTGTLQTPATTAATTVQQLQFNANWETVAGASGYRLDVSEHASFGIDTPSSVLEEFETGLSTSGYGTGTTPLASGNWEVEDVIRAAANQSVSGYGAQLRASTGKMTTPGFAKISTITFSAKRGASATTLQVSKIVNGVTTLLQTINLTTSHSDYTVNVNETASDVKILLANGGGNLAYVDELTINYTGSTPSFVTGYNDRNVGNVTTYAVTGLNPNTAYYYRVRATATATTSSNSNVTTVTTKLSTVTWNGTAWSNVTGPDATIEAVIAGAYNTNTNGAFTTKKLTLNSGSFTLASGTNLTVVNEVVNNMTAADFVIQNNANLIQTNAVANTGAVTLHRNSAPIVRLDHTLWSSPVEAQNLFGFSPNTLTNRFYTYQTSTNTYVNTGLTAATTFVVGKGFAVRAPNNYQASPAAAWEGTFVGKPNNGNVTFTLETTGTGYNMVGNPYPSVIDGATFVSNNTTIDGTLYFYAHTLTMNAQGQFPAGTNYATWTPGVGGVAATAGTSGVPANVPNGKIQVGQGFIVKSLPAGGNVTFANTMRAAENGNQFFKVSSANATLPETEKHRMWLNLTNDAGTAFNQILVAYAEGATEGVDRGYDGLAFGTTGSALSSKIAGADYTIQGRSLPFNAEDVVTLGFKAATAGNYSVTLSAMDGVFLGTQDVYLKDKTAGVLHDLKAGAYAFASAEGTFDNRFEIVYKNTLGTVDTTLDANAVVVFRQNAALHIETKNTQIKDIAIFDIRGRLVYQKANVNAGSFVISDLTTANEVLLVQVKSEDNKTKTVKVIY
ncbi:MULTISPECIES: T9SS sorting signal type C domain-containing protein [unclassified Flavobacterium]|uniref:beta strand repeat-containing protein n=1 Tax=unclassified Flavobacterium TaxID=196869 RepID=UPI001AD286D2|nr:MULTISPECIES: T9SS sorting signal type C domain-containing protein [unclassified Flavobacterium]MBN9283221.1 T9SS sorting signal type C domain-containing protein [Flavobacterium sp.]